MKLTLRIVIILSTLLIGVSVLSPVYAANQFSKSDTYTFNVSKPNTNPSAVSAYTEQQFTFTKKVVAICMNSALGTTRRHNSTTGTSLFVVSESTGTTTTICWKHQSWSELTTYLTDNFSGYTQSAATTGVRVQATDSGDADPGTYWVRFGSNSMQNSYSDTVTFTFIYYSPLANFSTDPDSGIAPLTVNFTNLSSVGDATWLWDFGDGSSTSTSFDPVDHEYAEAGTYTVCLTATDSGSYGADTKCRDIEVLGEAPASGLTKPLRESETNEQYGTYDIESVLVEEPDLTSEFPYSVYAFSNTAEAKVAAVAAGTVISLTPYFYENCPGANLTTQDRVRCFVQIPRAVAQQDTYIIYELEIYKAYLVEIQDAEDPDIVYHYWLTDVQVKIGDQVSAGCHIGKVIQLLHTSHLQFGGFSGGVGGPSLGFSIAGGINWLSDLHIDAGFVLVWAKNGDEDLRLYPSLSLDPQMNNCGEDNLGGCVTENAGLNGLGYWSYSDATANPGNGVVLHPAGTLFQDDLVVAAGNYNLTVEAQVITPVESPVKLYAQIDQLSHEFTLTNGDYQTLTWPVTFGAGGATSVLLINDPQQNPGGDLPDILIRYVCLSPIVYGITPGTCRFANHHFDADGLNWTTLGTVTFASGQAYLNNNEVIEQAIPFFLSGEETTNTYRLTAGVRLIATNNYTGQAGKSTTLQYRYQQTGTYQNVGFVDSEAVNAYGLNLFDGKPNLTYLYQLSTDFNVTSESSELVSFKVVVSDANNYIQGLRVDWVCLEALSGESGVPSGGGFTPPFVETCAKVPTPDDNNVSSWTYYHWKNLERVFSCDLMKLLNKWFSTFDQFQKTVRYVMRYWIVFAHRGADWLTGTIYWANGHFRNIAVGQVTTVEGSSSNTIWDVLRALIDQLLSPVTSTFLDIIRSVTGALLEVFGIFLSLFLAIINFLLKIINQLLSFASLGRTILATIISSYNNSPPLAIPGAPNCITDPESNFFCRAIWVLDNTIYSGRWEVIIPLIIGFWSIHLLLWAVESIKELFIKLGNTS